MSDNNKIVILGVFVADATYRATRAPNMGETILGRSFMLGPGGKGSNQAIAAARLGADVTFISRLGNDFFADLAEDTWAKSGVKAIALRDDKSYTGSASIFIEDSSGDNAIIICPGAAADITVADIEEHKELISTANIFLTQLEQPVAAALYALQVARNAGVTTILNPAPAMNLEDSFYAFCDYITPNETEAEQLTGVTISTIDDARKAANVLLSKGVGSVIITLGELGALLHNRVVSEHVAAFKAGLTVDTTGAGDAFNGAFVASLASGLSPLEATQFGCAAAGLSVTTPGAASSMPNLSEVNTLLLSQ